MTVLDNFFNAQFSSLGLKTVFCNRPFLFGMARGVPLCYEIWKNTDIFVMRILQKQESSFYKTMRK